MWSPGEVSPRRGRGEVELTTPDGQLLGTYLPTGATAPAVLFRGDEMYVRVGEKEMRTLGHGERVLMILVASPKSTV